MRKYRRIVLLMLAVVVCPFFPGCGGEYLAQPAPPAEKTVQPITFQYDHAAGLEVAERERKPTLIFFSVPKNVGSQRMMETTFRDDEIRRLSEWLVCIHVDGLHEPELCDSLGVSSFPTIILLDTGGAEVRRLVGRQTPGQLAVQIHALLQVMAQSPQTASSR
ncbi:MAG: thioredoxin family protein [Planctomycetaceae bacterium]|jgi:hypothetical protein|nr:thioredoxin family protein [Planctomycetaceae bacterium]